MKAFFFILVLVGIGISSCDEEPLCSGGFLEGPYLKLQSEYPEPLFVSYSNTESVGGVLRLLPQYSVDVPLDAHSSQMKIVVSDRTGRSDSILIGYTTDVYQCDKKMWLNLSDIQISRDTSNALFTYFSSSYESELLYRGNSVDISSNEYWPISNTYGVIVR